MFMATSRCRTKPTGGSNTCIILRLNKFESSSLEGDVLNRAECCNSYVLKEARHACKNFDFLKHRKVAATHFTNMATNHSNFSVVGELSSSIPNKIAC